MGLTWKDIVMSDRIVIREMEIQCRIGVPDEERAEPQTLRVTIEMEVDIASSARADDIGQTVNYFSVYQKVHTLSESRPRKLIETLAEEIAHMVIGDFDVNTVVVRIDKFILPNTRTVSVEIQRHQNGRYSQPTD